MNKGNKVIRSNKGKVWLDGEEMMTLSSINAKATAKYEDMDFVGDSSTHQSYVGWSGKGSLKAKKVNSILLKKFAEALKTGEMPDCTIITSTAVPEGGAERVALKEIRIDELTLVNLEAKKVIDEELNFSFSDFDVLETL